jgi:hypothetical protein
MEIVGASVTGGSCVNRYRDFIAGKGFANDTIYQMLLNEQETADDILQLLAFDYAFFGGFAIHVNYNANYQIVSIHHVPFENVRLGKPNEETGKVTELFVHPDWGKRNTSVRKWKKDDIVNINFFDPSPETIEEQVAGNWADYKGQILYFSNKGKKVYPLPIYDQALTDMNTEEAVSDITNRNASNGFLPAGMFVEVLEDSDIKKDSDGRTPDTDNDTEKALKQWQGSKNACKIGYIQVPTKEDVPQFIKMSGVNYDKEYTVSRDAVKDSIGRAFNQPPILRSENVGSGFGAEILEQAYNYYNSVTEHERLTLERVFVKLFKHWKDQVDLNFEIQLLTFNSKLDDLTKIPTELLSTLTVNEKRSLIGFEELKSSTDDKSILAEKIGVGGTQSMVDIVSNTELTDEQKRGMLRLLFGLTDEQVTEILPL